MKEDDANEENSKIEAQTNLLKEELKVALQNANNLETQLNTLKIDSNFQ